MNYIHSNQMQKVQTSITLMVTFMLSGCVGIPSDTTRLSIRNAEQSAVLDSSIQLSHENWPAYNWWELYKDHQLNSLMQRALLGTPTLDIAEVRVRQARNVIDQVYANAGPSLSANGTISRELESENGMFPPPYAGSWLTNSRTTLDFKYEFDWWGKHRSELKAALGATESMKAEQASAILILTTSIAQSYFSYQTALARLSLAQNTIDLYTHLLKLDQLRQKHGLDPITQQHQTEGSLASAQRNKAIIKTSLFLAKSQLQALLGVSATEMPALSAMPLPEVQAQLPRHLGLDLVAHRPDLQAARWGVDATLQYVEAAKAEFYPDINLTAFLGLSSLSLDQFVRAGSQIQGIAPAIHLPIFDSGRLKANLGARRTAAEYAIAEYNKTLVDAVKDVTDQALTLQGLSQQQQAMNASLQSAKNIQHTIELQIQHGLVNQSAVIQANLTYNNQKDANLMLANQRLSTHVSLIRALGGGYNIQENHHG